MKTSYIAWAMVNIAIIAATVYLISRSGNGWWVLMLLFMFKIKNDEVDN